MMHLISFSVALVAAGLWLATAAQAAPLTLQNGTATFSQDTFNFDRVQTQQGTGNAIDDFVDGVGNAVGWAIFGSSPPDQTQSQVGVWEIALGEEPGEVGGLTDWTFELLSGGGAGDPHTLGALRILYTTSNRAAFADGMNNGGNVGLPAIWTPFDLDDEMDRADSDNDLTMVQELAGEILRFNNGPSNRIERYTITATTTSVPGITGLRLEVVNGVDPLPTGGPGRASNGNFILREFSVDAVTTQLPPPRPPGVPVPSTAALFLIAPLAALMGRRRRPKK